MLTSIKHIIATALLLSTLTGIKAQEGLQLWYKAPANKWTDALPIGNGRLGAMIFGGIKEEHLQFNESTLWTGEPRSYQREGAAQYLPQIRNLLFDGKQAEAEALAEQHFMGKKSNEDHYEEQKITWLNKVRSNEAPAAAGFDDTHWNTIKLPTPDGWEKVIADGLDGAVWLRTSFELPTQWKGKNLLVNLGKIRDEDYTYVNGQLVGSVKGLNEGRRYTIPAALLQEGHNTIAIQVINWNDKGGISGQKANQKLFAVSPEGDTDRNGILLSTVWKYWVQDANPPAFPHYEADYQPFGDLWFRFDHADTATDYRRELNISDALSTVAYTTGGVRYFREYFASAPQQAIVAHFTANYPGKISLSAVLSTPHSLSSIHTIDSHTLSLDLQIKEGTLKGACRLYVTTVHGSVHVANNRIVVDQADEATFYLTAATNFKSYTNVSGNAVLLCQQAMDRCKGKEYHAVKAAHEHEYWPLFNAFSLSLGAIPTSMPTDERIRKFTHKTDPALIALYVQYGRYLLIASSRPGSPQPANLQGIWNNLLTPPWGSKYTTNINLEMNYWPAELLNLSSCAQPLFHLISDVSESGKLTAKAHYDAPGWVLHHNTDLWRGTAPINASNHGIWVSGSAWLCHHLWEHFLFTQDTAFLRAYYPIMQQAAAFYVDFLTKDPHTGYLISVPSNSPEHGGLVAGPAMDHQIIRDLFKNCIAAEQVLQTDLPYSKLLQEKYAAIAPNKIGRYGQLQEWQEDKDDTADTHRHVSHLWGVYPGNDITWHDPAMMKAAKQSLLYRGDGGTGWSIAWKVNLWARFKEGDHALAMVDSLLQPVETLSSGKEKGGVYNNLFDAHPPFQIDGNFGAAAGIAEMLVQSNDGYIELLPALPKALSGGEVKGICARGGFVLDITWANGQLQQVLITSKAGKACVIRYKGKEIQFATQKGRLYALDDHLTMKELKH